MITKELQQLSDKLVGSHTSAHEISKQVDYIEKNYEGGGGSDAGVFMVEVGPKEDDDTVIELKATWQEIRDAFVSGKLVLVYMHETGLNGAEEHTFDILDTVVYNPTLSPQYKVSTANVDYKCTTPDERPLTEYNSGGSGGGVS